ncbi:MULTISPECIES: aminopeptidase N [unclassified Micromonospora]|uniref:aminopeptidase N n=1 Tax=unclassified Micromonospora TaxID=2617518 RepID=UPI0003EECAFB|nr:MULTISPECIES: aminopeptidase N [unclassified Micromonospora]EWM68035.1 aminopeptidase N [Micromonospora sp. M42]MCK1805292.1 aminopeptidase N [Micromonospora sp. R42106]MCK1835682.1 aminopeptidase N [Micromonospora sp. R42003]MCK1845554.1 aminopeptidase N [Micromonospora sp. R42004]MCM1015899.1 aminopeptidase N [Micromonospora sp. XM-20-01]
MRNLTQVEATERARLLEVTGYDISLDLSTAVQPTGRTFRSVTEVRFCAEPGATTFIEAAAESVRSATLNGEPVDLSGWSAEKGLTLTGLAAENVLVVDADFGYSNSGQGLHRTVDPVDGETYLYSQFETADAQKVYACFDQPDLKSVYTWHATVPDHWRVVSNMPVAREEAAGEGLKTVHFALSERMSTYITALCAGPYHEVRRSHDGIDMGYFCRASMAPHMDADDLHLITTQGFDFFQEKFGVRYPLPKYDQLWVPDFNAGAMENFGCVTHAESHYIFRSQVTDFEYEQRANTILHELAHMWFGDLVTMRWWNDLWLNESFAEWASHWCNTHATRFTDAWTTFLSIRKNWGYRQDQLSSTHPVYCEMPDLEAVEVNFDGITYAKGASVLKQLVAYVGEEPFLAGLRAYFGKYAWGNATFDDLLSELETASGRELRKFAAQWLETAQVNTLRPEVTIGADGTYERVVVRQEAPSGYPTLRTHRIGVGLYDLTDGRLVRRELIETDVTGELTELSELHGKPAADVLLLNDEDLTYAKLRLDERSMATVVQHIAGFDSSLARALCWTAAWDMTRDAELSARDYVALVLAGLTAETDINLVTATLRQANTALTFYADPEWAPTGWADLARTARTALAAAEPGSGFQLAWARAYASSARSGEDLATLRGWLDGNGVPEGLTVDTELRWTVLQSLVANGAAGAADVDAELAADRTASGEREAAYAHALVPTEENKAAVWALLTGPDALPNWRNRALLQGFTHAAQVELTAPYRERYFATVDQVWAQRDSEPAQEFVQLAYPAHLVEEDTVAATDAWLAQDGRPASLRRLVAEGRDGVVRALRARERDARSA